MDQVRLSAIAANLTYLASKSRLMTALQAIAESELQSDPEYVMHHWISILWTDISWNAVFTAVLQFQANGWLIWLSDTNFPFSKVLNILILDPGWKHCGACVLTTFQIFCFSCCLDWLSKMIPLWKTCHVCSEAYTCSKFLK